MVNPAAAGQEHLELPERLQGRNGGSHWLAFVSAVILLLVVNMGWNTT